MDGLKASPRPDGPLGYNPRCLSRDLGDYTASTWFTTENLLNITVGDASSSIELFQNELQGRFGDQFLGMHATRAHGRWWRGIGFVLVYQRS